MIDAYLDGTLSQLNFFWANEINSTLLSNIIKYCKRKSAREKANKGSVSIKPEQTQERQL